MVFEELIVTLLRKYLEVELQYVLLMMPIFSPSSLGLRVGSEEPNVNYGCVLYAIEFLLASSRIHSQNHQLSISNVYGFEVHHGSCNADLSVSSFLHYSFSLQS